ncbi:MAG: bifunctional 4-hydroxy-3-methylbut-2-enyl diphosphate reductase/30S ribosomal protein S1 [Clostridia bacterium]|nr:bifunctional 4-hydroxy-3-methylbut-2-enyl diphosphate reductase/30S ribosomal protein S1 [Clostridia bacterium]
MIILAKSAGFCFGVQRAVESLEAEAALGRVSTLGPIIHNGDVVKRFESMGVYAYESPEDFPDDSKVAIRAHGVAKSVIADIEERGLAYADLTCPFVKKIHNIVAKAYDDGDKIVIIGDKNHPEVAGINGWCENNAIIALDIPDLSGKIDSDDTLCVVSQTTMDRESFEKIVNYLKNSCKSVQVFDTICNATNKRQTEAGEIAAMVDMMIVIGGRNSSNTTKLTAICKKYCKNTYQIENFGDLPQDINIPKKIGITAGASTPAAIIKEVVEKMEEMQKNSGENFAAEFEEYEKSLITLNTRDIVKGTVIAVSEAGVSVNLGYKSDGFVPASEVSDDPSADIKSLVKVGDEIEAFVVRVNDVEGEVTLSMKKILAMKGAKEVEDAFETKEILEGKVTQVVNGGVIVTCKGIRVFIPASQASDRYLADLEVLVGTTANFRIIDIKKMRGRTKIVGSIKNVIEEQKTALAEQFWAGVEVGKRYQGVVKSLTKFGAFADIGGVDGLIHISELSWAKIKHPSEVVKEGDVVDVYVISFDKETGKISLGFKNADDNPWKKVEQLTEGDVIDCKIVRIVPFGAFAEIYPGVDGLIHISQVADKRIGKVEDELMVGQHVQAKVVEIDLENKKIGLSIRALLAKEAPAEEAAEEVVEEAVEAPVEEAPVEEAPVEEAPVAEAAEETAAEEATEEAASEE